MPQRHSNVSVLDVRPDARFPALRNVSAEDRPIASVRTDVCGAGATPFAAVVPESLLRQPPMLLAVGVTPGPLPRSGLSVLKLDACGLRSQEGYHSPRLLHKNKGTAG